MKASLRPFVWGGSLTLMGFFWGQILAFEQAREHPLPSAPYPEISIIELQRITGDQLEIEVFGPVRILWAEDKMVEKSGVYQIPLGQIPDENDLKYKQFAYVGNAKTGKFYPSNSYPARGTETRHRRFFQTKQAAIDAGFIATKLVK